MLICIDTHKTCDFPGGGGGVRTPYPPYGSAYTVCPLAIPMNETVSSKRYTFAYAVHRRRRSDYASAQSDQSFGSALNG